MILDLIEKIFDNVKVPGLAGEIKHLMDCSTGIRKVKKNWLIAQKPNRKTDRPQSFDNFNCPEICDRSLQFAKEINDRSYYSLYNL